MTTIVFRNGRGNKTYYPKCNKILVLYKQNGNDVLVKRNVVNDLSDFVHVERFNRVNDSNSQDHRKRLQKHG